jgi:hypothetical protein
MTGKVFEYFFEPEELEPLRSKLSDDALFVFDTRRTPQLDRSTSENSLHAPVENLSAKHIDTDLEHVLRVDSDSRSTKQPKVAVTAVKQPIPDVSIEHTSRVTPKPVMEKRRTRARQWGSVHSLGQFLFCPRAGILAMESENDVDVDEPTPRLNYLPNFDLHRIIETLRAKFRDLAVVVTCLFCCVGLCMLGHYQQEPLLLYPAIAAFLFALWQAAGLVDDIFRLAARRRAALKVEQREPDPNVIGVQPVNWWSMLKAGFESVNYDRPFRHAEMPLEGCPWRVLERDSQRIPIIQSHGKKLGDKNGELYRKHRVRLAAYAILLEESTHIEVPFGIALLGNSPHGLAVRITPALRTDATRYLHDMLQQLQASQRTHIEPRLPNNRNCCARCAYGKPVATTETEIESALKPSVP